MTALDHILRVCEDNPNLSPFLPAARMELKALRAIEQSAITGHAASTKGRSTLETYRLRTRTAKEKE